MSTANTTYASKYVRPECNSKIIAFLDDMCIFKDPYDDVITPFKTDDMNKLYIIYSLLNSKPVSPAEFEVNFNNYCSHNITDINWFNKPLFIECMTEKYPDISENFFNPYHFTDEILFSADKWGCNHAITLLSVGIGDYEVIHPDSDHHENWKLADSSNIFHKVCYYTAAWNKPVMHNAFKSIIRSIVDYYTESLYNIVHADTIDEFNYWFNEFTEQVHITNDEGILIPLSSMGGFHFTTLDECNHVIELMSLAKRLNDVDGVITVKPESSDDWVLFSTYESEANVINNVELKGINLLLVEIVHKYIQLTGQTTIPKELFIELDPTVHVM